MRLDPSPRCILVGASQDSGNPTKSKSNSSKGVTIIGPLRDNLCGSVFQCLEERRSTRLGATAVLDAKAGTLTVE